MIMMSLDDLALGNPTYRTPIYVFSCRYHPRPLCEVHAASPVAQQCCFAQIRRLRDHHVWPCLAEKGESCARSQEVAPSAPLPEFGHKPGESPDNGVTTDGGRRYRARQLEEILSARSAFLHKPSRWSEATVVPYGQVSPRARPSHPSVMPKCWAALATKAYRWGEPPLAMSRYRSRPTPCMTW